MVTKLPENGTFRVTSAFRSTNNFILRRLTGASEKLSDDNACLLSSEIMRIAAQAWNMTAKLLGAEAEGCGARGYYYSPDKAKGTKHCYRGAGASDG